MNNLPTKMAYASLTVSFLSIAMTVYSDASKVLNRQAP
jgi:hypothetical protein